MSEVFVIPSGPLRVNSLVVSVDGKNAFVVDPAGCRFSRDSSEIVDFLKSRNLNCFAVVLTHTHFDHISGIREVRMAFPECKIAVHKAEADELNGKPGKMNESILDFFGFSDFLETVSIQPEYDTLLKDGDNLSLLLPSAAPELKDNLSQWKIIHTPGHSPGSICIYNENEKLMLSGDTLFKNSCGRTDMYGGNETLIMENLDMLDKLMPSGTKVYPGHDEVFTIR